MFIIGLTGGIAAGKSAVADHLKTRVAAIIDADEVAKEIIAPGTEVYHSLTKNFGSGIVGPDGTIDRGELGRLVFADRGKLDLLNRLTHPLITERIRQRLGELSERLSERDVVILRAPLLVEAGLTNVVDLVLLVTAPEDIRVERIKQARGLTEGESWQRLRAQLPDSEKMKCADHIIDNAGSFEELHQKVDRFWDEVQGRLASASGRETRG